MFLALSLSLSRSPMVNFGHGCWKRKPHSPLLSLSGERVCLCVERRALALILGEKVREPRHYKYSEESGARMRRGGQYPHE